MSATKLTFVQGGILGRDSYADLLDKSMDVVVNRASRVPVQSAQFFTTDRASTMTHKRTEVGNVLDLPVKSEDTDDMPRVQPAPGYDKSFTLVNYRSSIEVTRTLVETDQKGKIRFMMSGLMDSVRRKVEYMLSNVVIDGPSTAGADGSYLFADDHYYADAAHGTWSNSETSALLTSAAVSTMRTNMRKRKNEKGMVSPIKLKRLVVPPALQRKADQIVGSSKVPEDSLNAEQALPDLSVVTWDYLTSDDAWYGWGDLDEALWGLVYVVRVAPNIAPLSGGDTSTDVIWGRRVRFSVAAGGTVVRNMHYNQGT